jgi:hypothetical protein
MSVISTLSAERRVVVVVDGDFPGAEHPEARRVIDAVSGAHALVVAPAGPVAGSDGSSTSPPEPSRRSVGSTTGGRPLRSTSVALHVRTVDVEVGDASPTLAAADAQHAFRADAVIATRIAAPEARSSRGWALARLADVRPRRSAAAVVLG